MNRLFVSIISLFVFILFIFKACPVASDSDPPDFQKSWDYYKNTFITLDGRVKDFQKKSITTSEGQSYAMLRAVMIDDRETFDNVYKWTNNNLKRKNDNLYSWEWGPRKDTTFGVLDKNSATDADVDIAFALIIASEKWNDSSYLADARKIISDIWTYETKVINKRRILTSGYEQTKVSIQEINPSYFAPYAFRFFAKYDKTHDWHELVDSSYFFIKKSMSLTKTGLPPNWFLIDEATEKISINKNSYSSDFSYDAVRTFIRFYMDFLVFGDRRAGKILSKASFFKSKWRKDKTLFTNYKYDGSLRDKDKFIGSVALLLPAINYKSKKTARDIYLKEISKNYNKMGYWKEKYNYYGNNLCWFGLYIYFNKKSIRNGLRDIYEK